MTAALRDEKETVFAQHSDDLVRAERLGIHDLLANGNIADGYIGLVGFTLKVKFHRLLKIGDCFFARGTEAGNIHIEASSHEEFVLPINAVSD